MMSNGYQYRFDICNSCDEQCRVGTFETCGNKVPPLVILTQSAYLASLHHRLLSVVCQMLSCCSQAPGYQYSWASHCKTMGNVNDVVVRSKGQDWVPGKPPPPLSSSLLLTLPRSAVYHGSVRRIHRRRGLQVRCPPPLPLPSPPPPPFHQLFSTDFVYSTSVQPHAVALSAVCPYLCSQRQPAFIHHGDWPRNMRVRPFLCPHRARCARVLTPLQISRVVEASGCLWADCDVAVAVHCQPCRHFRRALFCGRLGVSTSPPLASSSLTPSSAPLRSPSDHWHAATM
jgi:hypothetical protein